MQTKSIKRFLAMLLSVALMFGILPMTVFAGDGDEEEKQEPVCYYDQYGTVRSCTDYTVLANSNETVTLTSGWYLASGSAVNFTERVQITGEVHIILGGYSNYDPYYDSTNYSSVTLNANKGFHVPSTSSLTFYAQDIDGIE